MPTPTNSTPWTGGPDGMPVPRLVVFGGGHVVLPWLYAGVGQPGGVTEGEFLAGYGATQAMPGPMFAFASYLGALRSTAPHGVVGSLLGVLGIYLGKTYDETKQRPLYVINHTTFDE